MVANVKTMMYYGEVPWHGLGTKLNNPATAQEAIIAAGLDFMVEKEKIFTNEHLEIKGSFVTIRTDLPKDNPGRVLGIVGERYAPLQNKNAFSFFDAIVGEEKAIYHTAGALGKGERIWLLAKLPGEIQVAGDDITEKFLLLTNSHDGSSCIRAKFTPIRVVCQNTLNAALREGKEEIQIRHTPNAEAQLEAAGELIKTANLKFSEIADAFRLLAKTHIKTQQLEEFLKEICPDNSNATNHTRTKNVRLKITELFETGKGNTMPEVRGTLWTLYNASTEFVDHVRTPTSSPDDKLRSIWFGSGAEFKQRAFQTAMRMAGAMAS